MEVFVFVIFVVAVLAGVQTQLATRRGDQRAKALEKLVEDTTMELETGTLSPGSAGLPSFTLLEQGDDRRVNNLVTTEVDGLSVRVFDFAHTLGTGKSRRTMRQSAVIVESPALLDLPNFSLIPERGVFGKLFGEEDIDFSEDPEFSRGFTLRAGAEEHEDVRDLFQNPVLRAAFTEGDPNTSVEIHEGDSLIYFHRRVLAEPEKLLDLIAEAVSTYHTLLQSHRGEGGLF